MMTLHALCLALMLPIGSHDAAPLRPAGQKSARTVEVGVNDTMKYSVTTITAKPGETLRIVIKSTSTVAKIALAHNLVILKPGTNAKEFLEAGAAMREHDFIAPQMKDRVIAATPMAGPGETVEVTFTVPEKPGSYEFICTFTGHYRLGMKGTLVVK
jgi:azurin